MPDVEEAWATLWDTEERLGRIGGCDCGYCKRTKVEMRAVVRDAMLAVVAELDSPTHDVPLYERLACRERMRARIRALGRPRGGSE